MHESEERSILTICLMAAFADGGKGEREREEVRRIAQSLGERSPGHLAAAVQDVLLRRASLDESARALASPGTNHLTYELAVCVCDADGVRNEAERRFLAELAERLGIAGTTARSFAEDADAVAEMPLVPVSPAESGVVPAVPAAAGTPAAAPQVDGMVLNYAILCGALELLPDSLATMAIIPMQMKMVYRVGKAHGYELDRGHVKDFLATAGVGLTSQYLEQIGSKLVGGLLKKVGGDLLKKVGRQATSSAFSFATTYALGHVAKRYYAGGRTLSAAALREAFSGLLGEAKSIQERHAGAIAERARTLDVRQVLAAARG